MLRPPLIERDNTFSKVQYRNIYTNKNIQGNYSSWKINVDGVLTTNNSLYGIQSYLYGSRILAIGQTNPIYNGLYSVTNTTWKRSNDMLSGISVNGVIIYDNFDGYYYFCSNISGEDIVEKDELHFLKIDFEKNQILNYRENAIVIKDNNEFKGSYIQVGGDNSLQLNGRTTISTNEIKTTIPVDINIYSYIYYTQANFETNDAPRGSNIIFNQPVFLPVGSFTVNSNQSIMFGEKIRIKDDGITFLDKYFSDTNTLTHDIENYRSGNIVLSSNIITASGVLTIVCNCDYSPGTVYANVQNCSLSQRLNISTSTSGNVFSILINNVGNSSTDVDGVKIGFVCLNSP